MIPSLRKTFQPKLVLPSLTIGVVFGIRNAVVALAFALMVFSGDLTAALPVGITALFLGAAVFSLVASLGSSLPGMMSGVQDSPSVILSVVVAGMLAAMPGADPETQLYTALAAIMVTGLLTGLVCILLGKLKMGSLVSYIPYPVVGGFLAGTGVLLLLGALRLMTGRAVTLGSLGQLFRAEVWPHWAAGAAFAVVLFVLVRRFRHFLVLPGALAASVGIFYLVLALTGTPVAEAAQAGWLVSGVPQGGALFQFWDPAGFARVDWGALLGQAGSILACVVVSLISMLLNTTALELSTGQEIDLNNELRNTGLANLIAAAAGSVGGYPALSNTSLAYRMGARIRLNGVFVAAVILLSLFFGGSFLGYFPNLVLGGLLFFVGLDFVYTWLVQTWVSMPRLDYAIIVVITVLINTWGFLQGVAVGLGVAVLLFVVQYSRTRAIRHILTGVSYQSSVERTYLGTNFLRRYGDWLYILELQGYIFFGTATQVLDQIRARIADPEIKRPPRYIILDFRMVSGLDSSAAFSFTKIKRLIQDREIDLILTQVSPRHLKELQRDLPPGEHFHYFPDLDRGIEWCEEQMIETFESTGLKVSSGLLFRRLARDLGEDQMAIFRQHLKPLEFQDGERILAAGSKQGGLHMIESGQVRIQIECEDGSVLRLRTLGVGAFFGEMGLYSGEPVSADAIAEGPTTLQVLTADGLADLEKTAPAVTSALHRFIINYMSERLAKLSATVQALR